MISGKKIAAVIVAYNAEKTLERTVNGIPEGGADILIIVDDASKDNTFAVAKKFPKAIVIRHEKNMGYGAAQKSGYNKAMQYGADVMVMIHGDFQYDPSLLVEMARPLALGTADACFGSRMQSKNDAWKNGMPWWRFVANVSLSKIEEQIFRLNLSEYHTGYRAYTMETLKRIPFNENSDDFVFDSEFLAQAAFFNFRIGDVPIPTRYFSEASSINLRRSITYGVQTLLVMAKYLLQKAGLIRFDIFSAKSSNHNNRSAGQESVHRNL